MDNIPTVDILFKALVFGDENALDFVEENRALDLEHIRAIMCKDDPNAMDLNLVFDASLKQLCHPFSKRESCNFYTTANQKSKEFNKQKLEYAKIRFFT